jgi:hypothetical protein
VITDHAFTPGVFYSSTDQTMDPERCCAGIGGGELCGQPKSEHANLGERLIGINDVARAYGYHICPICGQFGCTRLHIEEPSKSFEEELRALINRYSVENRSNTPDIILAMFIVNALEAFNDAVQSRDEWYGFQPWAKEELEAPDKEELMDAYEHRTGDD